MAPVNRQLTEADRKEVRMKYLFEVLAKVALIALVCYAFTLVQNISPSDILDLAIIK
jgi:hypothetical protein